MVVMPIIPALRGRARKSEPQGSLPVIKLEVSLGHMKPCIYIKKDKKERKYTRVIYAKTA